MGRESVNHPKVQNLGNAPLFRIHIVDWHIKHQRGRGCVDIFAPLESFKQAWILRYMGQHPQFNLGVVGGEQQPIRSSVGHESPSHLTSQLGADGYIL